MSHRVDIKRLVSVASRSDLSSGRIIVACGSRVMPQPKVRAQPRRLYDVRAIAQWLLSTGIAIEGDLMTIHTDDTDDPSTWSVAFAAGRPIWFDPDREDCSYGPSPGTRMAVQSVKDGDSL